MAAATVATGYPIRDSLGSLTLLTVKFSSLADTNTYATGLTAGQLIGYWASSGSSETAGEEGVNVAFSAGTFTLGLKTTSTEAFLFILFRS